MDNDNAFIKIQHIFCAKETENNSHSWKMEMLRQTLDQLQTDSYNRGVSRGLEKALKEVRGMLNNS